MTRFWTVALLVGAALSPAWADTPLDWRDANDTVGRFPRGHIDLLRWEQQQPAPTTGSATSAPTVPQTLAQALARAWAREPAAFVQPGMSPAEAAAAQVRAAGVAHETRRAWFTAIAAEAGLRQQQATWDAADTGAELARRMQRVGHWSAAQATAEHQLRLAAGADLVRARVDAQAARERLGALTGQPALAESLPTQLPEPPATVPALRELEALALQRHPQLSVWRLDSERDRAAVAPAALERAQAHLLAVAQGAAAHDPLAPAEPAPPLRLDPRALPGWSHALENALTAQARADALAATVRAQVREAWLRLGAAHELATATQAQAVPAAEQQMLDGQQRYNGMLASTWELLARSRALAQARRTAEEARLAYWLAHNDLLTVLAGGGYSGPAAASTALGATPSTPAH